MPNMLRFGLDNRFISSSITSENRNFEKKINFIVTLNDIK